MAWKYDPCNPCCETPPPPVPTCPNVWKFDANGGFVWVKHAPYYTPQEYQYRIENGFTAPLNNCPDILYIRFERGGEDEILAIGATATGRRGEGAAVINKFNTTDGTHIWGLNNIATAPTGSVSFPRGDTDLLWNHAIASRYGVYCLGANPLDATPSYPAIAEGDYGPGYTFADIERDGLTQWVGLVGTVYATVWCIGFLRHTSEFVVSVNFPGHAEQTLGGLQLWRYPSAVVDTWLSNAELTSVPLDLFPYNEPDNAVIIDVRMELYPTRIRAYFLEESGDRAGDLNFQMIGPMWYRDYDGSLIKYPYFPYSAIANNNLWSMLAWRPAPPDEYGFLQPSSYEYPSVEGWDAPIAFGATQTPVVVTRIIDAWSPNSLRNDGHPLTSRSGQIFAWGNLRAPDPVAEPGALSSIVLQYANTAIDGSPAAGDGIIYNLIDPAIIAPPALGGPWMLMDAKFTVVSGEAYLYAVYQCVDQTSPLRLGLNHFRKISFSLVGTALMAEVEADFELDEVNGRPVIGCWEIGPSSGAVYIGASMGSSVITNFYDTNNW